MASNPVTKVTEEQYLAIDRAAEFRSEFIDGEIVAMSGASLVHNRLQGNVYAEVRAALRDSNCEAFNSDLRMLRAVLTHGTKNSWLKTNPALSVEHS